MAYKARMRMPARLALLAMAALCGSEALADNVIVTINNGSTNSLLVTVYDMNASPPVKVMSNSLINGNASLTVLLTVDSYGQGHLSWTAATRDSDMRSCGKGEKQGLNNEDSVTVDASSSCSDN
jgi:hypothetical protein